MNRTIIVLLLLVSIVTSPALAREKSDVVWLVNGDRITGEIKQLEHGRLYLSTDSFGDVSVEWNDISRIESDYDFQFERSDGTRVTGIISKTPDQKLIKLTNQQETVAFPHENIIRISQMEDTFWNRLQGSLSLGYSFTKVSNVAQGNFAFNTTHRTEKRALSLEGSTIFTSDQEDEGTQRSDITFTMTRFRPHRWFNSYTLGFESNDELGLNLRSSIGAGFGRYLIQTNTSEFAFMGGIVATSESLDIDVFSPASQTTQENIEGMLGLDYSHYVYDHPAVNLSARLAVFPSITDRGRTRAQLDFGVRWELISDLFWDLSYYNTYDSDPASNTKSTSDYGIVTSLGYSF